MAVAVCEYLCQAGAELALCQVYYLLSQRTLKQKTVVSGIPMNGRQVEPCGCPWLQICCSFLSWTGGSHAFLSFESTLGMWCWTTSCKNTVPCVGVAALYPSSYHYTQHRKCIQWVFIKWFNLERKNNFQFVEYLLGCSWMAFGLELEHSWKPSTTTETETSDFRFPEASPEV